MAELPLLIFPTPESATKTDGHGFGGNINRPSTKEQSKRLGPMFKQLQNSFNARKAEIRETSSGIDPEQVLVFETVGNIDNFANAVKRIPGLEWLGEFAIEGIPPNDYFHDRKKPEKELSGRLYLIMSNQTALTQMLSLWHKYVKNPKKMIFKSGKYRGLANFIKVFLHLRDIRRWGVEDRLADREIFEAWEEDLKFDAGRNVRFEAELWYRGSEVKREESESLVAKLILELGGRIISQCVLPSIAYHSVLGEISAEAALQILEQPAVNLIKCDEIMFFRPTGQMVTKRESAEGEVSDSKVVTSDLPAGDPLVAVLDGLPLENHMLLSGRLIVDDPDDWSSEYPAFDRQHGTAMNSLVIHGDLTDGCVPLNRLVYTRPILKPMEWNQSPRPERAPEDILFVDHIHRAVKRILEGDGEDEAVAPTVKIINLSIGDSSRHFSHAMSPLARLLDWLSFKYKVLFIISSGNHSEPIDIGISGPDFEALSSDERESHVVKTIYADARHRRLLSPAESINGLTVGAIHQDNSVGYPMGFLFNVFESPLPSPISAFGSGYRRAIKPDFLYSGGRVLFSPPFGSGNSLLQINNRRIAPGNQVAAPSNQAGELNKSQFRCGSSNSAALASRAASICYDYIVRIFNEVAPNVDLSIFGVPLLKAMLVHSCEWNEIGTKLDELLRTKENSRQVKSWISRWIGYGIADVEKVQGCNEQRATLLGYGQLSDGKAHVYRLPLPPSLGALREWRKFTVTLAWLSPVASATQKYREAQLWFDFEDGKKSRKKLQGKLRVTGIDCDSDATRRGTVQHEVFEGKSAVVISDGDTLKIRVNCRKDARKFDHPVAYGLVVSLEVADGINLPIYDEIRTRIKPEVEIRA